MPNSLTLFTILIKKLEGVYKNHAIIGNYSCIRKTYKLYTKSLLYFLEETLCNAFIIYSKVNENN